MTPPNRTAVRLFIALAIMGGSVSSPAAPRVVVEAAVDAAWTIEARASYELINDTAEPRREWLFSFPTNRDADPGFVGTVEALDLYADNERGPYRFDAPAELLAVRTAGRSAGDAVKSWSLTGTELSVVLEEAVQPGQSLDLELHWRQPVPEFRHYWGRTAELCLLADWYPLPRPNPALEPNTFIPEKPWIAPPPLEHELEVNLTPPPGWALVGGAGSEVLLLPEARLYAVGTEVWEGRTVKLVGLVDEPAPDFAWAARFEELFADWIGGAPPRLILSADVPVTGEEAYREVIVIGEGNRPWLWRANHLLLARQLARRRLERPDLALSLLEALSQRLARRALVETLGEGRDLLPHEFPAEFFDVTQQRWNENLIYSYRAFGYPDDFLRHAERQPTPELYDIAARRIPDERLAELETELGFERFLTAVRYFLGGALPDDPELLRAFAEADSRTTDQQQPTTDEDENNDDPDPWIRLLPELFSPERWTLSVSPFGWLDEDDSLSLGCALWGRRGVSLAPMELWGTDDVLLVANYNLEHDDYNLLAQYTTPLAPGPGRPRFGLGAFARRDEIGAQALLNLQWSDYPGHAPRRELTLGLEYAWMRPFVSYYPNGLEGDDGRQLSAYASFFLDGRGPLGGVQSLTRLEYAFDPLPGLSSDPAIDYWRLWLVNQLEYRLASHLHHRWRLTVGQVFGHVPSQRLPELTEDNVEPQYHLLRRPQAAEMRGYNDLDIFGEGVCVLSAELNTPLLWGLEAGVFCDYGEGGAPLGELFDTFDNWRASAGPLLRWRIAGASVEAHFPLWINRPYDSATRLDDPAAPRWDWRVDLDASLSF